MARSATAGGIWGKGVMANRVEEVLFRTTMGIMTGNTGRWPRRDLLVGIGELHCVHLMTSGAERADFLDFQVTVV
jgi:hypothetical protein